MTRLLVAFSGYIEDKELGAVLTKLKLQNDEAAVKQAISEIDTNGEWLPLRWAYC